MTDKQCEKCNAYYDYHYSDDKLCPSCMAIKLGIFWIAKNPRVSMYSDGNQFIVEINAGFGGETYLSVGYSSPNYAWITNKMIPSLQKALDEYYETITEKNLEDMLDDLLKLCQIANTVYNKLIWNNHYEKL